MFWFAIGFAAGTLFTCWRYHVNRGALVAQAERVAQVYTLSTGPVGPELERLGRIYFSTFSRSK